MEMQASLYFRQAVRLAPNYFEAAFNLANHLRKFGNIEESITILHRALTLCKNSTQRALVFLAQGLISSARGNDADAVKVFEKAVRINPDDEHVKHIYLHSLAEAKHGNSADTTRDKRTRRFTEYYDTGDTQAHAVSECDFIFGEFKCNVRLSEKSETSS